MTDAERTPTAPRRSGREKKPPKYFTFSSPSKRKRVDGQFDEDNEQDPGDAEILQYEESDVEDDYVAPRKPKTGNKGKAKERGPPAPKKPRVAKAGANATKTSTRKSKKNASNMARVSAKTPAEAKISNDNALFNSIMNPDAALQSVVEDFLESFQQSPQPALADLINCFLRSCGSNDSVDSDRVVDYDGIVDALDDFTEVLKEDEAPTYPLTSKHPMFKKFRKSLSELLTRLVHSSAELGALYSSDLLMTIQAWVVAMSSSQLRSFRHTATVLALEIEIALCEVAAEVEKEAEVIARQREGERKRKGKGASTGRERDFEAKATDVRDRRSKLAEYLKEFFDGVFIHRYRDLDPSIRTECVRALGYWVKTFPAHFLDGQYLRYVGWVLSDANTHVRLEAVRALAVLYSKEDFIVPLQSFTERFRTRLAQMAAGDTEPAVRVSAVQVLSAADAHGLLEDEQREQLGLLAFDTDAKVRKAAGAFVEGIWTEARDARLVGKRNPSETERNRAGLKALAQLFVRWGRALDRSSVEDGDADGESSSQGDGPSSRKGLVGVLALAAQQSSRIALAVEALWDEVEIVGDWEAMLELLLLDHSASTGVEAAIIGTPVSSRRKKTKKIVDDDVLVDEAWRLDEAEEAVLLEILIASLRKTKTEAATGKKAEEDTVTSQITRELIKSLPGIIAKHQTDENRIANALLIPEMMNMDMYLEMRMITAYEALWDDVIKQFLTHSSPAVLANSMATIRHLMGATSLSNTNSTKILELEDELASSLRDAVGGRDELEVATFSDDEARTLGAICARLCALAGTRDLTAWMDEDEGGKQSSAWDIVSALAERGRLGYKEEDLMVDRALHLLSLHVIWKTRTLARALGSPDDQERLQEVLREQRDALLEKLVEYAVGSQSNTLLTVRRAAFQNFLTLHILFSSIPEGEEGADHPLAPLSLSLSDEVQYRCAGFVQAEVERYAEDLEAERPHRDQESGAGSDTGSDVDSDINDKQPRPGRGKKDDDASDFKERKSRSQLEQEYVFSATMATFLRALRAGVTHVRHGAVLLAHFGRLGPSFDLTAKLMVDILREEGMYKDNGSLVVEVLVQALKESFTLLLDRIVETEKHTMALAKAVAACLVMRGAQLSIIKRLPGEYVVDMHTALITWIVKRISTFESNKNKRGRRNAILFFRVLLHLLTGIEARDALKIKAVLDQEVARANIDIPPTSKTWEPYRAYEKRLNSATAKEAGSGAGKKGKDKAAQSAGALTTDDDEEGEVEGLVETNGVLSQLVPPPQPQPQSRPRPRPAYRREPSIVRAGADRSELTRATEDDRSPTPPSQPPMSNGNDHPAPSAPVHLVSSASPNVQDTSPSKKRSRTLTDEKMDNIQREPNDDTQSATDENALNEIPQSGEIIVRRKRVRH